MKGPHSFEGVAHQWLLWLEAASSHLAGLEGMRIFRFHSTSFLAHLPLQRRNTTGSATTSHEADRRIASLDLDRRSSTRTPAARPRTVSWGVCNFTGRGQQRPYTRSPAARPLRHQASALNLPMKLDKRRSDSQGKAEVTKGLVGKVISMQVFITWLPPKVPHGLAPKQLHRELKEDHVARVLGGEATVHQGFV